MEIEASKNDLRLKGFARVMSLPQTLDCGQAFRWRATNDTETEFSGVVGNKLLLISSEGDDIILHNTTEEDYYNIWENYFDVKRDYESLKAEFSEDEVLKEAISYAPNIRVLSQEPWETTVSFIISANNNIKRIKGIIDRLCESFGEKLDEGAYTFPTAERLAELSLEELEVIRAGFRNKYILDCAKKVASGEIDFEYIKALDTDSARKELMKIKGIGPKVAECALLFGFNRAECFPMDTWMKKVMTSLYPQGLPSNIIPNAGIAQQYLFHYARNHSEIF